MTDEVMMVPTQEFVCLADYYKEQITQSALLNKAGRLAAEEHFILKNPTIPDSLAVKMVKSLAREQARLTKRIRTGTVPTAWVGAPDQDEELEAMAERPLLRRIVKGTKAIGPAARASPGPSDIKIK